MQKIISWAASALALAATGAQAQPYVEGHFVPLRITGDHGLTSNPKPGAFVGIVGYGLHPNLAIEGVLGAGIEKDRATRLVGGTEVDTKIRSTYGFYLKPRYQINEAFEVYARIGHLRSKVQLADSFTRSSTAWGLGLNYAIDRNTYITAGYNELYKKDGVSAKGLNLGVGYKF